MGLQVAKTVVIKKFAAQVFARWGKEEQKVFTSLLEPAEKLLDVGCGDGRLSKKFAQVVNASRIDGIEGSNVLSKLARGQDISVSAGNLNQKFPYPNNFFNVVISHFSLEHLYNSGLFIQETQRVLKKDGYTVVATDNLASWPNIASLILGWQPFSTAGGVAPVSLGNPFGIGSEFGAGIWETGEFSHNKVMAYQQLKEAYEYYGFIIEKIIGIGYFPFSGTISKILCRIDTRHAHLLLLKARKK